MKKFYFTCLLVTLCAASTPAQKGAGYRYDNYDTKTGVRIVEPTPDVSVTPQTKSPSPANGAKINSAVLPNPPARDMAMLNSATLDGFTTGDAKTDAFIVESSKRNQLDPVLIYAQMHQESSFKKGAVSPKGASGLMQLMPFTARRFGVTNIFDQRQNIEGGARYMRFLLDLFGGNVRLALAGYNAGEGAVMKYGRRIPPYRETEEYVRRISNRYALMRDPQTARKARTVTPVEIASVRAEEPVPLTTYERNVFAVRLPNGRLQLVSQ